nr:helix-turn-helix domain-containing protein [Kribbella steppae]
MARREELREFLRARRAAVSPGEVGLPDVGKRRTPGLRREEVASLAGVGVSWYTWLEQGRDINVSGEVLDAISKALRLSEPERSHLYLLAGLNPPVRSATVGAVTEELRRLVDAWSPRPAILRDQYWNLLAINDATRTVFGYDDTDHNCLISFFTNAGTAGCTSTGHRSRRPSSRRSGRMRRGLLRIPSSGGWWTSSVRRVRSSPSCGRARRSAYQGRRSRRWTIRRPVSCSSTSRR